MIVEVKQEHIDEGTKGCPCYCAVSLAVYDALKNRYKFTDSESLDFDNGKEEVDIGESWILSIDGKNNHVCLFNLYEQLDYTNTNLGTGQVMLSETKFYPNFNQDKDYTVDRKDVIMKLKKISQDATESHVKLRLEQEKERQEMFNAAL